MRNKVLTIFCIFILLSLLLINNCYATTFNLDTVSYIGEDGYNWVIYQGTDEMYYLIVCTQSAYQTFTYYNNHLFATAHGGLSREGEANLYCFGTDGEIHFLTSIFNINISDYAVDTIKYSSSDIYVNKSGQPDGVFFQLTPVDKNHLILPLEELLRVLEHQEMTQEIITTIVGLAKLLIPLLICLLGFWKAWHLLLRLLRKA